VGCLLKYVVNQCMRWINMWKAYWE